MTDLFALTAELVDIASESFAEGPLVERIEAELVGAEHLEVTRVGDNLVARTIARPSRTGDPRRSHRHRAGQRQRRGPDRGRHALGGGVGRHEGRPRGDARTPRSPTSIAAVDVTYVFYAREEVAVVPQRPGELFEQRPDLLAGDLALLGEPTDAAIEAGCQGSIRAPVTLAGPPGPHRPGVDGPQRDPPRRRVADGPRRRTRPASR